MKKMLALLLTVCALGMLCACGTDAQDAVSPSAAVEEASPTPSPSPSPSPTPTSSGDQELDLAYAVGRCISTGFDTVQDRGKYTLQDTVCRLFYLVKNSRLAGSICIAPDGSIYAQIGSTEWTKVTDNGDGTYTLPAAQKEETSSTGSTSSSDSSDSSESSEEASSSGQEDVTSAYTPPPVTEYTSGSYAWPVAGYGILSFGYDEPNSNGRRHAGIDIAGSDIAGASVGAVDDGTVSYIGDDPEGYGTYVCICHSNGEFAMSLYAQLADVTVSEGDSVSMGETIGHVGNSGSADGYHLHLGIYASEDLSSPMNPMCLFPDVDVTYLDD